MSRSSATGLAGAGALLVAASLPTPWYTNHLGLYGEEFGPQAQHLHNFPQAFTHLARPSTWTTAVGSRPRWMTASLAADVPLVRLHCRSIGGAGRVCGECFWNHRLDARHQEGRAACLSSGR